jgi:methylmalonyl-CoA/ethylmalonyl-CoA epimerase
VSKSAPLDIVSFSHVGFSVHSVAEFMATWGVALGLTDHAVHEETAESGVIVSGADHGPLTVQVGYARVGNLPVELIETTAGRTCHADWAAAHGPSLHHLAFWVRDLPAQLDIALSRGFELVMTTSGLARAVLTTVPQGTQAQPELEAGATAVPDFFAFVGLPQARTQWMLELLDVSGVETYRSLNGDYPGYPDPAQPPTAAEAGAGH